MALTLIYSLLGVVPVGAVLGVILVFTGAVGGNESLTQNPVKFNFAVTSAALTFSTAMYAVVLAALLWAEMDMGAVAESEWSLYVFGGFALGGVLASIVRGVMARNALSDGQHDIMKFVPKFAMTEILVLPGLVAALSLIFGVL